jgi:predicted nucleotidyltransferase
VTRDDARKAAKADLTRMKKVPRKIHGVLAEVREGLAALYGTRLKEVILYGSFARGDYAEGSDLDLLVLVDGMGDPAVERERYLPLVCDLSLKHDLVVSVVLMDAAAYRTRRTPLILNAQREGVGV